MIHKLSRLLLAACVLLVAGVSFAQGSYTSIMSTQTFSSSALPSGWSNSGFFWNSNGNGGANGSWYLDIWGTQPGPLATPSTDISAYASNADSIWVDFDFFWEYNYYCTAYSQDLMQAKANSDVLLSGYQSSLYTYSNTSDYAYNTCQTSSSYWRHYHILIPVADRTSTFQFKWGEQAGWGCSDYFIDNVSITGFLVPPSHLLLSPKSLNFGSVGTGGALTLYDTVYSLGPAALTINSASLSGSSAYTIASGPANGTVVPVGSYAVYGIQFAPTQNGALQGTFTVATNATTFGQDAPTQSAVLNGTGAAAQAQYTFLPYNGVTYPDGTLFHHVAARFGQTVSQKFLVTSNGAAPLIFSSFTISGLQANMYQVTHVPPNPLAVGATDSVVVSFTPQYEGRPDATLNVVSNAINIPNETVTLWGTGILPHLVVTPQEGMVGTGTTPGSLTFDSVAIGDSVCKTLALHNTGTDTLTLTRQLLTYGDYDFTYYPLTGTDLKLAPDQTKLVNVCFVPVKQGIRLAQLRYYTNIPKTYPDQRDTSQFLMQISGTGVPFGKLALSGPSSLSTIVGDTMCFNDTIWNKGSADLTIKSYGIQGPNANADYTLGYIPSPIIIHAGGFQVLNVCFHPTTRGLSTATISVMGTTSGTQQNQLLAISGNGQVGCMSAAPNPVPFGSTKYPGITLAAGNDSTLVTVTNCGDVPMTFTAVASPAAYTVSPAASTSVAPNGTATFMVHFKPTAMGAVNGTLTITPSETSVTPVALPLGGVGGAVVITASGTPTNTAVGSQSNFTITLTNSGNVPWNPGAPVLSGDYSTSATTMTPSTITPTTPGTLSVTFKPTQLGARPGSLTFSTPDITPQSGMPYNFTANGLQGAGVSEIVAKDGYSIGASYPNPASKTANVIVTMPHDAKATVALVRIDGSQVASVFEGSLSEGQHTLSFDVSSIASGTYFYSFESGTTRLVRQMVIAK